jgi:hypothetical protein
MRDIPTSPRIIEIKRNRRIRNIRLSILFFILIFILVGALAFFSNDKHVVIDNIEITGTHIIDHDQVLKQINSDLSGRYAYLFSRSNSFIYPHKIIYNNLLLNFPRIESLSITKDGPKNLKINITERVGSYLYCGLNVPENKEQIGENCFFLNNDGFIFDKAPYFSGNVYFKYYMALPEGVESPLGKQMTDVVHFHQLARFIDGVISLGFKPIYLVVDQEGNHSLYLEHNVNITTPKIIFKNDNDLGVILDNLSLSMKKKEFADEINSKYNTLLYIDLRFNNKVLYKFQ